MRYQVLYLNQDPFECAKEYTDEHVKVMCLRLAQTFSYVYRKTAGFGSLQDRLYWVHFLNKDSDRFYRWILRSNDNYMWMFNHFKALLDEHQYRFDKPHPSADLAEAIKSWKPPEAFNGDPPFSAPPYEEDAKYARDNNKKPLKEGASFETISAINSYRAWYDSEFRSTNNFTKRPVPAWSLFHAVPSAPTTRTIRQAGTSRPPRPDRPNLSPAQRLQAERILGLTDAR